MEQKEVLVELESAVEGEDFPEEAGDINGFFLVLDKAGIFSEDSKERQLEGFDC